MSIDNENDEICNATLSNPHHVGEIVTICSRKRIANLHNMDNGEFPNFDTGIIYWVQFSARTDSKQKKMQRENLPERNFTARNVLEARRPPTNTCRRQKVSEHTKSVIKNNLKEILLYTNY